MTRVMAQGTFDLLHPGHLHYLRESAALGDELVVVIARDSRKSGEKDLVMDEGDRREMVDALEMVDRAVLGSEDSIYDSVADLEPDIITLGHDQPFDPDSLEQDLADRDLHVAVERIDAADPAHSSTALRSRAMQGPDRQEAVWFRSGDTRCFGILHRPDEPRGLVVLCHGYSGSHIGAKYYFRDLARRLADRGLAVLRFDQRGSGDSGGDFADQTVASSVQDVTNGIRAVQDRDIPAEPLGILGHSKGGTIAAVYADDHDVDALATWSTVADYTAVWPDGYHRYAEGRETVAVLGFEVRTASAFEPEEYDLPAIFGRLDCPLFMAHGRSDRTVPLDHMHRLADAAGDPDTLILDDSDHIFSDPEERAELVEATADWFADTL